MRVAESVIVRWLRWELGFIAVVFVAVLGGGALYVSGAFYDDGCPVGHAPWSCLDWSNIDRFEEQLRADIPVGTSGADVRAYLARENIRFRESPSERSKPAEIFFGKNLSSASRRPSITLINSMIVTVRFDRDGNTEAIGILYSEGRVWQDPPSKSP